MCVQRLVLLTAFTLFCLSSASAQPTYSIDYQGPTKGVPDPTGAFITEGDLLAPFAGVPIIIGTGGFGALGLGLPAYPLAVGLAQGVPGGVEVDALSFGADPFLTPNTTNAGWNFSVESLAVGFFPPLPLPPNVTSEGALGTVEASADVYTSFPLFPFPPGPQPLGASGPANTLVWDGDGIVPPGFPGLSLVEPSPPMAGPLNPGDNLDALDLDQAPAYPIYFSLDSAFFDFGQGVFNTGSAIANGFASGADILVTVAAGAAPAVYAPAATLGLDLFGFGTDDLDALVLWENGDGIFVPSMQPYDWFLNNTDMVFFSVRRNSALIGVADSLMGFPIEEGDILFPNGPAGTPPGIWIPAENLGLCTIRSCGGTPSGFGDDLDALDLVLNPTPQRFIRGDCNADASIDISDPVTLLSFLFFGAGPLTCDDACDMTDDELLGLTDAISLLNFLFLFGPPPPPPYPVCGVDPTAGPLGCAAFPPCP